MKFARPHAPEDALSHLPSPGARGQTWQEKGSCSDLTRTGILGEGAAVKH